MAGMPEPPRHAERVIHTPRSLPELFGIWDRFPEAVLWAAGTSLSALAEHPRNGCFTAAGSLPVPPHTISLDRLEELHKITRTERYLEIGAMKRLDEIVRLGKIVPGVLTETLTALAGAPLRNLITIGGLVSGAAPRRETAPTPEPSPPPSNGAPVPEAGPSSNGAPSSDGALSGDTAAAHRGVPHEEAAVSGKAVFAPVPPGAAAALIALDARFELRGAESSRWISAARFYTPGAAAGENSGGRPGLKKHKTGDAAPGREILTRIRLPLEQWNYAVHRKFHHHGGTMVFCARIEKNILTALRAVFAGNAIIRSLPGESFLTGKSLPLERRFAAHFAGLWQTALDEAGMESGLIRSALLNCIEDCALGLTG